MKWALLVTAGALLFAAPAEATTLPVRTARAAIVKGNLPFFDGSIPAAGTEYRVGHCTRKDPKHRHARSRLTVYCAGYAAEMFGVGCGWWDRARLVRGRVEVDFTIYTKLACNGDHPHYTKRGLRGVDVRVGVRDDAVVRTN